MVQYMRGGGGGAFTEMLFMPHLRFYMLTPKSAAILKWLYYILANSSAIYAGSMIYWVNLLTSTGTV